MIRTLKPLKTYRHNGVTEGLALLDRNRASACWQGGLDRPRAISALRLDQEAQAIRANMERLNREIVKHPDCKRRPQLLLRAIEELLVINNLILDGRVFRHRS